MKIMSSPVELLPPSPDEAKCPDKLNLKSKVVNVYTGSRLPGKEFASLALATSKGQVPRHTEFNKGVNGYTGS